jgi:hypothetical protein
MKEVKNAIKGFVITNIEIKCFYGGHILPQNIFLIPKHSFIDLEFNAIVDIVISCSGIQYFCGKAALHGSLPQIREKNPFLCLFV